MRRYALYVLMGSLVGFGLASCTTKTACTSSAQCSASETCLPSQVCAHACDSKAQCGSGEKCSTSGGCVDQNNGCGTTADCLTGQTCQTGGTCAGKAADGGSGGGAGGGTGGTGGSGGQGGGQCADVFNAAAAPANLMIVLDKSSSMQEDAGSSGTSKWVAAKAAVNAMTDTYPDIHFGLTMFSAPSSCNNGQIFVHIGAGTGSAIQTALPAVADGNGTPIAGGLTVGSADTGLSDPDRSEGVVLVTDGNENCHGDPAAVVDQLFKRTVSVRTYVVGFGQVGSKGVNATLLTNMAIKGGTARSGTTRYYQADVPADLQAALTAIGNSAQGCSFVLSKTPTDLSQLYVAINQQIIKRDTTHITGWDYDPTTNRVTLYGPACDILANTSGAQLTVQWGCSDGLIETSDGGFDYGVDAGEIG